MRYKREMQQINIERVSMVRLNTAMHLICFFN